MVYKNRECTEVSATQSRQSTVGYPNSLKLHPHVPHLCLEIETDKREREMMQISIEIENIFSLFF